MAFPKNDKFWQDTANFLLPLIKPNETIFAPIEFKDLFENVCYTHASDSVDFLKKYSLIVFHKGIWEEIEFKLVDAVVTKARPVFANEVFVVFDILNHDEIGEVSESIHLQSFIDKFDKVKRERKSIVYRLRQISKQILSALFPLKYAITENEANPVDVAPSDAGIDYSSLTVEEIKNLMDRRYATNSAYQIEILWDKVRAEELNNCLLDKVASTQYKTLLEIGCGVGGVASYISDCYRYVGTDLSSSAIEQAISNYGHRENFQFKVMDAMNLAFDDGEFDIVIAKEVIEHLPNPETCLQEIFRVLKQGGKLVLTSPNRDSLHLRINRKLGYSDFKCSFDHIKELTYSEARELITKVGFEIHETGGVFLMPYWGIPGIDETVRGFTDNDPEVVEILRDLGSRVGPEYAFCYVFSCIKP